MFKMVVTMMMKARVMSWGLVILLNHGAGALWVGLNVIFALTLLQRRMTIFICCPSHLKSCQYIANSEEMHFGIIKLASVKVKPLLLEELIFGILYVIKWPKGT